MEKAVSQGLSRASKRRKRKSLSKTDAAIEAEDADEPECADLSNDAGEPEDSTSPTKKRTKAISAPDTDTQRFEGMDITTILNLKEVEEVESDGRFEALLGHLVAPLSVNQFRSKFWDTTLYHSARSNSNGHFKGLVSLKKLLKSFQDRISVAGTDVHIDGVQEGSELTGKDIDKVLTKSKQAVKLLNPQKYFDSIWKYLYVLESGFEAYVGCHAIIAPPACVAVDVEANNSNSFYLQLEGTSSWELSNPADTESSKQYQFDLHAGDSFYLPRNWSIKCSNNDKSANSLSLYLFTNEGTVGSVSELFDLLWNQSIESSIFSKAIPRGLFRVAGVSRSEDEENPQRDHALNTLRSKLLSLVDTCMESVDAGVDQLAKNFMMARQPPPLTAEEEAVTSAHLPSESISPFTNLRMVRPGVARVLVEEGMVVVYHCMDNSREMFGAPINPMEFELDDGPAIEALLDAYPHPVTVQDLPHASEELEDKIAIAKALYKEGLLMIIDVVSQDANCSNNNDDDPF